MSTAVAAPETLVLKRTYAAPAEKLYRAWTDPAQMVRWFSSNVRWISPVIDTETVPGGRHNILMRHSDGDEYAMNGHYVELVPDKKIVFTWTWKDTPTGDEETLITVEFQEVSAGSTELTLTHERISDPEGRKSALSGWTGFLEMLEEFLEGKTLFKA